MLMSKTIKPYVQHCSKALVVSALIMVAIGNSMEYEHALCWLCSADGVSEICKVPCSALLSINNKNVRLAYFLIKAGVQISYQDVLGAVKLSARGVEAWMAADAIICKQQGVCSKIPPLAEVMCLVVSAQLLGWIPFGKYTWI